MGACPSCSVENPEGAKFCFACGAGLAPACPNCREPLPVATAKFCPSCGHRIETVEAEKLLKLVTVLFADVVSSTERAEKLYPDEIKELMESFFATITPEITAEGGVVDSFAGDAVMAMFGVPVAHEDDPLRAVRAARRMIAATERWGADKADLHKIRIRIGINTGEVLAAAGDATVRVTGDAVNVAARLESKAPVMEILIGERTARAVRPHFKLRSVGGLEMKGKSEPVPGYIVEEPKEIVQDRGIPGLSAPLIGRDLELKALQESLEEAVEHSHARTITVMADAGVGKSRLSREMFLTLSREADTVSGKCLPYGDGVTLWPLIEILMSEAGILFTDPPELVSEKIGKLVRELLPDNEDRPRIERALGATFGLPDVQIDPRELFREIVDGWGFLLEALSIDRALVVLIEDIHWADSTMLEVLKMLTQRLGRPVLFVCTARPSVLTSHPTWKDLQHSTVLSLQPLTDEECADLIDHLLGSSDLPGDVLDLILSRAEGNPFYVEEILSRLIDEGYLVREDGRFRVSGDIATVEIPDSVQGVILARLDLLSVEQRRLIQNASVMGRSFWVGALTAADDEEKERILMSLEDKGLVHQNLSSSMGGEIEYSFKHILIRDVAYETLPRKRRAAMHVEAAEWIERVRGDRVDELAEVLAHHYHLAFDYAQDDDYRRRARDLYGTAAAAACKRFALKQSATHAWTAVDLSRGSEEKAHAYEQLGDIQFQALNIDGAWLGYSEGLTHLLDRGRADAYRLRLAAKASLTATRWETGMQEPPDAETIHKMVIEGLEGVGSEHSRERAMLLASRAFMHLNGWADPDDPSGERSAHEALQIAEELGDADVASAALDAITYSKVPDGLYGQAATTNRRRLELIPQLNDVKEICDAYIVAAWTSSFAGRYAEAAEAASACVERAAGVDPGSYVLGLIERVHARVMLGDFASALGDIQEIETLERGGGKDDPAFYSWKAYAFAALAFELVGDEEGFVSALERFHHLEQDESGRAHAAAGSVRGAVMARALLHRGELEQAQELISTAPGPVLCANLETMCEYVAEAGKWEMAPEIIAASKAEAQRAELDGLMCFALRLEGRLAAATGDVEAAGKTLERSAHGFAVLGAEWEKALSLQLVAETSAVPERERYATLALETFERLGTPLEIARSRALLAATSQ